MVVAAMTPQSNVLGALAAHFALISLFAVGGANAVVPEMHRQAVEIAGWMTERQFADTFALAQVVPGPNVIIVTLIGFQVAGLAGALVATLAMCGPTCVFAYFAGRTWERFKDKTWRIVTQAALVPISIGLMAATAFVLAVAADRSLVAVAITAATAGVAYWTKINPLWVFAVAGLLGLAGFV
jgi:chromate transporter